MTLLSPPRRPLWRTVLGRLASPVLYLFDATSRWPMILAMSLCAVVVAFFAIDLIGLSGPQLLLGMAREPTPPSFATAPMAHIDFTCAEQEMMRAEWRVFADGLWSGAPHPWTAKPSSGLFYVRNEGARAQAYQAIDDLVRDGNSPATLNSAADLLRGASGVMLDHDRSIVQFHRGLVLMRQGGKSKDAVSQFQGVQKAIAGSSDKRTQAELIQRAGISVATEEALGVALSDFDPSHGAQELALAAADLGKYSALLRSPGDAHATVFRLQPATLVDLDSAEVYADAIAANLRVLARARCEDPDYAAAIGALKGYMAPFRGNAGVTSQWPQLASDLQLAAAMLGDAGYVKQFPILASDDAAAHAGTAARLAVAAPQADLSAQGDAPVGAGWSQRARWRTYLYLGQARALYDEMRQLPASSQDAQANRKWLSEMLQAAMASKDTAQSDKRRLWTAYGDMAGGTGWLRDAQLRAPFGFVPGVLLLFVIAAAYVGVCYLILRVRWAYSRMFVSDHRRERMR